MDIVELGEADNTIGDNIDETDNRHNTDGEENVWANEELAEVKVKVFQKHKSRVTSCQFLCDGRKVVSASFDHDCIIWDTETAMPISYLSDHGTKITRARLSPDQKKMVTCGFDKRLMLWDLETERPIWSGYNGGIVMHASFSDDAAAIVCATDLDYCVAVWDARSGRRSAAVRNLHSSTPTCCLFAPTDTAAGGGGGGGGGDGSPTRILSTAMDWSCACYDLRSERVTIRLRDHSNVVAAAALTPDERKLVTASWDKSLRVYDISTGMYRSKGSQVFSKVHEGCVSSCNFSSDGLHLVSGGYDNNVVIWDILNSVHEVKLQGHDGWVEDVCFSPDNKWVLSASRDNTVRMWNIEHIAELPVSFENKLEAGANIVQCSVCGKPFSLLEAGRTQGQPQCVFCRLSDPERYNKDIVKMLPPTAQTPEDVLAETANNSDETNLPTHETS